MRPTVGYVLWAIGIAEALTIVTAGVLGSLSRTWRGATADTLFIEGAVFLVVAGVLDLARSVTVRQIRALSHPGAAPPVAARPGRLVVLLIAGLVLCGQGFLLAHFLSPGRG